MPRFTPLSLVRSLSGRLLLLTMLFVLIGEVLIYVPSVARFRLTFLQERLDAGHLASRALDAAPEGVLDETLEAELLAQAMVEGVVLRRPEASMLLLSSKMPPAIDATYDLREAGAATLIMDAFEVLWTPAPRTIRVLNDSQVEADTVVEVILMEHDLRAGMIDYSGRILQLSLIISLITAGLVYFALHWMIVRPMRHITENLVAFRRNPEDARNLIEETDKNDEIALAQHALHAMESQLRASLLQKTRLAALGAAMSRINHDLRNSLASAMVVSDSLALSEDPDVRKVTPRLISAIDRAVTLCSQTLDYAQSVEPKLDRARFALRGLVDDVEEMIALAPDSTVRWVNDVPEEVEIDADKVQMFRVLLNLGRNAVDAMEGADGGELRVSANFFADIVTLEVADTGPGLPRRAQDNLFQPFAGSARAGGTGLGLAIARELVRLHGGEIELVQTGEAGTRFRITLPAR